MKKIFKAYFMEKVRAMIKNDEIEIPPKYFEAYGGKKALRKLLYKKEWVVFTKKPFSTCKHVIDYLGRYSHRVAITDRRIIAKNGNEVFITWKDYRDSAKTKELKLEGSEFIRRFCLHILPPHYRKIRQYGLTSNASKAKSIAAARKALGLKSKQLLTKSERKAQAMLRLFGTTEMDDCTSCRKGKMKIIFGINKNRPPPNELLDRIKNQNPKK